MLSSLNSMRLGALLVARRRGVTALLAASQEFVSDRRPPAEWPVSGGSRGYCVSLDADDPQCPLHVDSGRSLRLRVQSLDVSTKRQILTTSWPAPAPRAKKSLVSPPQAGFRQGAYFRAGRLCHSRRWRLQAESGNGADGSWRRFLHRKSSTSTGRSRREPAVADRDLGRLNWAKSSFVRIWVEILGGGTFGARSGLGPIGTMSLSLMPQALQLTMQITCR